jgi:phenylacetate-coenzyme A ligase PaaK-like adenylate-forming protein
MIISTENRVDNLTVEVESKNTLSQMESMDLEEKIKNDIKSVIVFNPRISILQPKSIVQEGLKAKRVIDNRKR